MTVENNLMKEVYVETMSAVIESSADGKAEFDNEFADAAYEKDDDADVVGAPCGCGTSGSSIASP